MLRDIRCPSKIQHENFSKCFTIGFSAMDFCIVENSPKSEIKTKFLKKKKFDFGGFQSPEVRIINK